MAYLASESSHFLDLQIDLHPFAANPIQLMVEELPETLQFASDCASTQSSLSTVASSAGCGCASSAGSIASYGCITSSGS